MKATVIPNSLTFATGFPEGETRALCEAVSAWRYEDLPLPVVRTVKSLMLDTLGAIGGARHAQGIAELDTRLSRWEPNGSATGLLRHRRYSPPTAALANGAAAHALDFDDQHDPARVHTGCVVLPVLLATAEDRGRVSGRDFVLAMVVGAEVHARLGLACHNSFSRGWHSTTVFGTLAASLAAGRLLGLDAEGLSNAFGIAYHQASGSAQALRDGALAKRLGAGFAARNAVLAAHLAADGLTGPYRSLEGNAGLFALYERGEVRPEILFEGLGESWHTVDYSFKPYPCCRCNHTPISLALRLGNQGVRGADVAKAEIYMSQANWLTVGEPYDVSRDSVVHAQFNACYSFARALTDGRVDLSSFERPAVTDPDVARLAERTRVIPDPAVDANAIEPVRIRVTLEGGRVVEIQSTTIKGSPADPMSEQELVAKLQDCLEFGLGATKTQVERLAGVVTRIEAHDDAAHAIVAAFPTDRRASGQD